MRRHEEGERQRAVGGWGGEREKEGMTGAEGQDRAGRGNNSGASEQVPQALHGESSRLPPPPPPSTPAPRPALHPAAAAPPPLLLSWLSAMAPSPTSLLRAPHLYSTLLLHTSYALPASLPPPHTLPFTASCPFSLPPFTCLSRASPTPDSPVSLTARGGGRGAASVSVVAAAAPQH